MMIPYRTPFFLPWLYPSLTWRIKSPERAVFLTFDDGPVDGPTDFVLEELKRVNGKATFFCIGDNIEKHPDVFERVMRQEHAVGNHTFNHLNGWKTPDSEYLSNVDRFNRTVLNAGFPQTRLFRPPYGKITRTQIRALRSLQIVMWDVLSFDFDKSVSPDTCLRNTLKFVRPGSIVVFHDSFKAERNLRYVLPRLVDHLGERQFQLKKIPG